MPAGVQRERPGLLEQLHFGFRQQPVAFAAVAWMAAGDEILPG